MISKVAMTSGDVDTRLETFYSTILGDGSDGDLTFNGSSTILGLVPSSNIYTLTRDIYVNNMTVNSGVFIFTDGFRIFVKGQLTNRGTIHMNGRNAVGATAGASYVNRGTLSVSAGGGGNGATTTAAGSNGAGSGGNNVAGSASGAGGAGGASAGGAGNSSALPGAGAGTIRDIGFFYRARLIGNVAANGGGGGGGGGAVLNAGTAAAGGGGGAAGGVCISCGQLDNLGGVISADGGAGANASVTGAAVAGGGGGGSGGYVIVAASQVIAQGTIRANPGAFGTGAGTGGLVGVVGTVGMVVTLFPVT